jgi:hypothetical protein
LKIKKVTATEYIDPLREGGSLPAIVKADDGETYAMKFRGAGQGEQALIAEMLSGEIARKMGFKVPEIVFIELDPQVGRTEPDPEIRDLLQASAGVNLGLKFLSHSTTFSLLAPPKPSADFASRLVWFDAFVTNVDRSPQNVNLLIHQGQVWLIDHGATLNFHHKWGDPLKQSETPFPFIKNHVLLALASEILNADQDAHAIFSRSYFEDLVNLIPAAWLNGNTAFKAPADYRKGYVDFLSHRLQVSEIFVEEAVRARSLFL